MTKQDNLGLIKRVRDEYGLLIFNMGFTHLMSVGMQAASDEDFLTESQADIEKVTTEKSFMTVDFQMEICRCAHELSFFSPIDLVMFAQKNKIFN